MSLAEFDVAGQKVLLVGAGRGIGKGIALAFAEAGADVAVTSLSEATVGQVAEEVRAMGRIALPVTGDATKSADMDRIASQVLAEFGHIDTLVNCVGDSIRKPVVKLPGTGSINALSMVMALHYGEELLDRDIGVIDLRLPDRPALRMQPGAAETYQIRKAVAAIGGEDT